MPSDNQDLPKWFRLVAAAGALLAFLAAAWIVWQAGLPTATGDHGPVQPFTATTLDGQRLTLDATSNQPVILNFWATWCVPCAVEMPRLQSAFSQYQARDLLVIGINGGREDPRDAEAYAVTHGLSFPLVMDSDGTLDQLYNVRGVLPTTIFIDADGRIQRITYGILQDDELRKGLAEIGIISQ